jgi:hypothetical protein
VDALGALLKSAPFRILKAIRRELGPGLGVIDEQGETARMRTWTRTWPSPCSSNPGAYCKARGRQPEAVLEGETIDVDGRRFIACELRDCVLVYSGGEPFEFVQSHFQNFRWRLGGAAYRTVEFLRWMRNGGLQDGPAVVQQFLDRINTPPGQ